MNKKNSIKIISVIELVIFTVLFAILFLQFFARYVLNDSPGWTEEIARYLLIILTFVGGISCVRKNGHIFLEFMFRIVSKRISKLFLIVTHLISVIFYSYSAYLSIILSQKIAYQKMVTVPISKAIIYYVIFLTLLMMVYFSFKRLVKVIRTNKDDILKFTESLLS